MADVRGNVTVTVHLDMMLNGESVNHMLTVPALMEPFGKNEGLVVHLHLDADALAKSIYPAIRDQLLAEIRATQARNLFLS